MGDVIVIQFSTLDGVVSDPDGSSGTPYGGWAFRYGSGPVSDDKFRLGARMEQGVQLYGRRTWESFSKVWPGRDTDYARLMNAVPKRVATRTGIDASAWPNSAAIDGDPLTWVKSERERRDIVVIGSLSLVHALAAADLVDEYRLIIFPLVAGEGDRLFAAGVPANLQFTTAEPVGAGVLTIVRRAV
ncbi:riboflavin biosynthesis protein RibD [Actinoplanes sp. TBRC 11911]|uniref:dihydrofolate reductase family protein n=1 Tax=Actinoplanes sp. TBRC 11911 TaxID=2729386 RepID=UPI00145F7FD9|nr:dihydrofolate reductase family protein [Actinoplanes sp. TBRC 11911]NMO52859.1 riboflavin biosynthesis protein RibD [Actinoplanes sp. TBRC 11911]